MSWRERAVCAGDDAPDDWFASPTDPRRARAIAVCSTCPVQAACAEYAIQTDQRFGVWSGTDLDAPLPRRSPDEMDETVRALARRAADRDRSWRATRQYAARRAH